MRDVELYRRPPVLTGDEPAVLRFTRGFRKKRRFVQLGFIGGVAALSTSIGLAPSLSPLIGIVNFAVLSSAFVVLHLVVGKRIWMKPMEVYEDGIAGCQLTVLFCRRRFVVWKDVESVEAGAGEGPSVLRVTYAGERTLESAPGEFEASGVAKIREVMRKAKDEADAARRLFESLNREPVNDG